MLSNGILVFCRNTVQIHFNQGTIFIRQIISGQSYKNWDKIYRIYAIIDAYNCKLSNISTYWCH